MNITPMGDKVVIKPTDARADTDDGVALAEISQEQGQKGVVIAVGPGRKSGGPMKCKVGESVLFPRYNVNKITVEGQDLVICVDDEVMCSVEDA